MNTFCGRTTRSATRIGWAMAQFLGTSSPNTICVNVTTMNAPVVEIAVTTPWLRPVSPKPSANRTPTDGPVRKPATRLVTVMPSCAPDRLVDVFVSALSTIAAVLSPASMRRRRSLRLTVR